MHALLPGDRQVRGPKCQGLILAPGHFRRRNGETDCRQPFEQRAPEHLQFHPGDLLPDTGMDTATKADKRVRLTVEVYLERVREDLLVK